MDEKDIHNKPIGEPISWTTALFGAFFTNILGGIFKYIIHFPLSDTIAGFFFISSFILFWVFVVKVIEAIRSRKRH